jgi:hypothetical protein
MTLQNWVATGSGSNSLLQMMPKDVSMNQTQCKVAKPLWVMVPDCQPHVVFQPSQQGPRLFLFNLYHIKHGTALQASLPVTAMKLQQDG